MEGKINKHIFYNIVWVAGLAWLLSGCAGTPAAPLVTTAPIPPTATSEVLAGCPDETQQGYAQWSMGKMLLTHPEEIQSFVWGTTDLYYVIEGEQKEPVTKEICDVTFTARSIPGTQPTFEMIAEIE